MFRFIGKLIKKLIKLFLGLIGLIIVIGIVFPSSSQKEKGTNSTRNAATGNNEEETQKSTVKEPQTDSPMAVKETETKAEPETEDHRTEKATEKETTLLETASSETVTENEQETETMTDVIKEEETPEKNDLSISEEEKELILSLITSNDN